MCTLPCSLSSLHSFFYSLKCYDLPMQIRYTQNAQRTKEAISAHFDHRHPLRKRFSPTLGFTLIVIALTITFKPLGGPEAEREPFWIIALLVLGALKLSEKSFSVWRTLKSATLPKGQAQEILINAHKKGLTFSSDQSEQGESSQKWTSFTEIYHNKKGLLLYQEKERYLWIPKDSDFEKGTWTEFLQLASSKVTS